MTEFIFDECKEIEYNHKPRDLEILKQYFPNSRIIPGTKEQDRRGIDWVVMTQDNREIYIDTKTRTHRGSELSCLGKPYPEIILELWSIMPGGKYNTPIGRSRIGWSKDETKLTNYVLYTFHPDICTKHYLFRFKTLKHIVAIREALWRTKNDKKFKSNITIRIISSEKSWESECAYVPVNLIFKEIELLEAYGKNTEDYVKRIN